MSATIHRILLRHPGLDGRATGNEVMLSGRCSMAIFATFAFEEPWPRLAKASAMSQPPRGPGRHPDVAREEAAVASTMLHTDDSINNLSHQCKAGRLLTLGTSRSASTRRAKATRHCAPFLPGTLAWHSPEKTNCRPGKPVPILPPTTCHHVVKSEPESCSFSLTTSLELGATVEC